MEGYKSLLILVNCLIVSCPCAFVSAHPLKHINNVSRPLPFTSPCRRAVGMTYAQWQRSISVDYHSPVDTRQYRGCLKFPALLGASVKQTEKL